jgi:UDP-N-acetylmuramyl pentapeptide phosphotransferase/UDP-N-acetylglucosamine-1-phosphate transferase
MTLFGFAAFGIALMSSGAEATLALAIVAATIPVYAANAPPARLFIGDVGAVPLGFAAALFGLAGWRSGAWDGWFPLLVFLPFIGDASLTLGRRIARRERLADAHRSHYYQRLVRLGAGHRGTLALYAVLMAGCASSALYARALAPGAGWALLGAWCAMLGAFFAAIDYHWRRFTPADP